MATTKTTKSKTAGKPVRRSPSEGGEYFRGLGRRKSATAIAKIYKTKGAVSINGKSLADYFKVKEFQKIVEEPLRFMKLAGLIKVDLTAKGGGMRGQAEAARLAVSRALVKMDEQARSLLRGQGLLTRDAREKERKKPGLKRARRAHQWRKR